MPFHFASAFVALIQRETRQKRGRRSAYNAIVNRALQSERNSTSIAFIHIHFTMVTRPPRFAKASVLGALFGANSSVFARIRVTRVLLASVRSRETSYLYVGLQSLAQESLTMEQKSIEVRNERYFT